MDPGFLIFLLGLGAVLGLFIGFLAFLDAEEGLALVLGTIGIVFAIGVYQTYHTYAPVEDKAQKEGHIYKKATFKETVKYAEEKNYVEVSFRADEPPTFLSKDGKEKEPTYETKSKILFIPLSSRHDRYKEVSSDYMIQAHSDEDDCKVKGLDEDDYESCEWIGGLLRIHL